MINRRDSFTSASNVPAKVLQDAALLGSIHEDGLIIPRHVSLYPTSKCNLKCSWCSAKSRDKSESLSWKELREIVAMIAGLGTAAVTIAGGGEPTIYPEISPLIQLIKGKGIAVGLTTNGVALSRLGWKALECLTWIQISYGDGRNADDKRFNDSLDHVLHYRGNIDLAFSYVVTENLDIELLKWIVNIANKHNFTHVRIVNDITGNPLLVAGSFDSIQVELERLGIDDSKIIYQELYEPTPGDPACRVSLLRPLIASDGYVYPCCGVSVALNGGPYCLPVSMRMGHYCDLPKIIAEQRHFDGGKCVNCYYQGYNTVLGALTAELTHREFL